MKALIVYDSVFGNTEKVAMMLVESLQTTAVRINQLPEQWSEDLTWLIIGSPTRAFSPTKAIVQ